MALALGTGCAVGSVPIVVTGIRVDVVTVFVGGAATARIVTVTGTWNGGFDVGVTRDSSDSGQQQEKDYFGFQAFHWRGNTKQ